MSYNHFVEPGFKPHAGWLSDEEYGKALDNLVTACADAILVNSKGEMLLCKRSRLPAKDWWIVGGRMKPGESFREAIVRNIKRELDLTIAPKRFSYLRTYSFVWARRHQLPQENGVHNVSVAMVLFVKDEEVAVIKLNEEHEELRWWNPELVAKDQNLLPAVRQYARDILAKRKK